ncbi:MAG: hypothetical protein KME64_38545 [Scytonematopsis contorta HA4267-MV1]|jgi:hypothetical protein|nr:hypothetical protein [Scytonematopsis contorta HA4267-MV1]
MLLPSDSQLVLQPPRFIWKFPQIQGNPPQSRYGHSAIRYQNSMIIFAGEDNETKKTLNDIYILNLESWTWEKPQVSGEIPPSRSFHTAVLNKEQMVVWGGYEEQIPGGYLCHDTAVYILELKTWHWSRVVPDGTPPVARSHHSAALLKDKLFIYGGYYDIYCSYNDLHLLDLTTMSWLTLEAKSPIGSASGGLIVRDNTLIKFFGDGGYEGFCSDILTLNLTDFDSTNLLELQWQKAEFAKEIENYSSKTILSLSNREEDGYEYYEEEEEYEDDEDVDYFFYPGRTVSGYGEFGNNLVVFSGVAAQDGVSHATIDNLILLNLPVGDSVTNGIYRAIIPQADGKFPTPRHGHSTIQFNHQMIIFGGFWFDPPDGLYNYDNDVYILEILQNI